MYWKYLSSAPINANPPTNFPRLINSDSVKEWVTNQKFTTAETNTSARSLSKTRGFWYGYVYLALSHDLGPSRGGPVSLSGPMPDPGDLNGPKLKPTGIGSGSQGSRTNCQWRLWQHNEEPWCAEDEPVWPWEVPNRFRTDMSRAPPMARLGSADSDKAFKSVTKTDVCCTWRHPSVAKGHFPMKTQKHIEKMKVLLTKPAYLHVDLRPEHHFSKSIVFIAKQTSFSYACLRRLLCMHKSSNKCMIICHSIVDRGDISQNPCKIQRF